MPPGITGTDVTSQPSQPADENTLKITNSDRTYTTRLSARTKPRVAPGQSQNETRPLSENNPIAVIEGQPPRQAQQVGRSAKQVRSGYLSSAARPGEHACH